MDKVSCTTCSHLANRDCFSLAQVATVSIIYLQLKDKDSKWVCLCCVIQKITYFLFRCGSRAKNSISPLSQWKSECNSLFFGMRQVYFYIESKGFRRLFAFKISWCHKHIIPSKILFSSIKVETNMSGYSYYHFLLNIQLTFYFLKPSSEKIQNASYRLIIVLIK